MVGRGKPACPGLPRFISTPPRQPDNKAAIGGLQTQGSDKTLLRKRISGQEHTFFARLTSSTHLIILVTPAVMGGGTQSGRISGKET
jgi:hypothetical protein